MSEHIRCWLSASTRRIFPDTQPDESILPTMAAARNDRFSFQVCVRNDSVQKYGICISAENCRLPVSIRRVGFVPVKHHNTQTERPHLEGFGKIPGLVPDPLFGENETGLGPFETQAFWVTVKTTEAVKPGLYSINLAVFADNNLVSRLTAAAAVSGITIRGSDFPVTHWFYADALCDFYKVEPFDERFWRIVRPYMQNMVEHGSNCLYVPIFTPPTDGVKRPTQLLRIKELSPGKYVFVFSDVKRWIDLAKECGAKYFEWTHFFSQWGVKNAIRIYSNNGDPESLLWPPDTKATAPEYRNFLAQFLPAFHRFLEENALLERSFFHVSDEPHGEEHLANYRAAREMLRELAPWMKVMDALSEIEYGRLGLTDMPVPIISSASQFAEENIPHWVYYCCGPRGQYLNRLMDTPLSKIRMHGFLFYKLRALGFLHWGYNYWYRSQTQELTDPFSEQSGFAWPDWAYGDTFVVYPGADGPIDSIRWEVFADAMADYSLLETLGIQVSDGLLSEIKGYSNFPFSPDWANDTRMSLIG